MKTGLVVFLAVLLTACNPLRPEPVQPPALPESYSVSPLTEAIRPGDLWWEDFRDQELDRLQQQMFAGNLDLRQTLHRIEQLEALQRVQQAGLLPSLNLNGSISRSQSLAASGETRTTSSSLSVAAGYEVDLWNKLRDRATAAELTRLAGEDEAKTLLLSLSAQLAEQYFLAVEQQAQLDLLRQQVERSRDLLEIITGRYRAGLTTSSALYQARRNLATIEAQVPAYRTTLAQAENALALLLGQPPGSVNVSRRQLPALDNLVDIGLPADLLTRRPDISAALLQLEAADRELAATLADRLPALDLSATLGRSANRLAGGDVDGTIWSLALGLTQPLFDGGRLKALSDQQRAVRAEQLAAGRQTMLSALEEVESSLIAEQNSAETAIRLERQRAVNASFLRVTRENYLSGLTDSSDWLNSEIDQLGILSQQLSNQRQWLSNRISLVRALGGSWMSEELNNQQQALKP